MRALAILILFLFAVLTEGCTNSTRGSAVDGRIIDTIAHSDYIQKHSLSLDAPSLHLIKEVNSTPEDFYEVYLRTPDGHEIGTGRYGQVQTYSYRTSDGASHTSNVTISQDGSISLLDVDGITEIWIPPVDLPPPVPSIGQAS